ncbi:hypothetical protein ECANGB1_875 [Enterospora canceri]|uniref:Uncharacterized protein n=1 Tax=Enterospora canceri TaxID=1081671 RepID=A0A1Y1S7C1_9MICR|nr:hypothetical protein ECANGB1_875 [Enterospora canceri]
MKTGFFKKPSHDILLLIIGIITLVVFIITLLLFINNKLDKKYHIKRTHVRKYLFEIGEFSQCLTGKISNEVFGLREDYSNLSPRELDALIATGAEEEEIGVAQDNLFIAVHNIQGDEYRYKHQYHYMPRKMFHNLMKTVTNKFECHFLIFYYNSKDPVEYEESATKHGLTGHILTYREIIEKTERPDDYNVMIGFLYPMENSDENKKELTNLVSKEVLKGFNKFGSEYFYNNLVYLLTLVETLLIKKDSDTFKNLLNRQYGSFVTLGFQSGLFVQHLDNLDKIIGHFGANGDPFKQHVLSVRNRIKQ